VLAAERVKLQVSVLSIEKGARVTTSANDRLYDTLDNTLGKGVDGEHFSGAGHVSRGGFAYTGDTLLAEGGLNYGQMINAATRGAQGGKGLSGGVAGNGGGIVDIRAAVELYVDGIVEANGGDADDNNGGGSAGSIFISAGYIHGHGTLSATGGVGGAGGSGGFIYATVESENNFLGTYQTAGGEGTSGTYLSSGGPGVAFVTDIRNTYEYRILMIDNDGHHWDQYYQLNETDMSEYEFEEVHLTEGASLSMVDDGTEKKLVIHKMIGDYSGRLHAWGGHTIELERGETSKTVMKSPINLWLDDGAKVYLATTTYIMGEGEVVQCLLVLLSQHERQQARVCYFLSFGVEDSIAEQTCEFLTTCKQVIQASISSSHRVGKCIIEPSKQ
jgi:hypothetical protein